LIVRTAEEGPSNFSIIEATGTYGVSSSTWNDLRDHIGVGKFYEKVAFRKLSGERSKSLISTFDEFMNEVWDLKYGIGLAKLASYVTNA
jgi:hypothetical protein